MIFFLIELDEYCLSLQYFFKSYLSFKNVNYLRNKRAYSMINKTHSHLSSIREAMEAMVNCTLIFAINACSSWFFFTCIRGIRVDHFVTLHVFTFSVPCYDVSYAFRVNTMFRILVSNMMCMSDNAWQ